MIRIKLGYEMTEYPLTNGVFTDRASVLEQVRKRHNHAVLLLSGLNKVSSTEETPSGRDSHDFHLFHEHSDLNSPVKKSEIPFEESEMFDCDSFSIDWDAAWHT
jgi:hypothetical protein